MVGSSELGVFNARDVPPQFFDEGACSSFRSISVIRGVETTEDQHGGYHVLYAVISVGEVVHGFMLFINDTDAGFMGATGNRFDVFCRFSLLRELGIDYFGSFDGRLGVEFSWLERL